MDLGHLGLWLVFLLSSTSGERGWCRAPGLIHHRPLLRSIFPAVRIMNSDELIMWTGIQSMARSAQVNKYFSDEGGG